MYEEIKRQATVIMRLRLEGYSGIELSNAAKDIGIDSNISLAKVLNLCNEEPALYYKDLTFWRGFVLWNEDHFTSMMIIPIMDAMEVRREAYANSLERARRAIEEDDIEAAAELVHMYPINMAEEVSVWMQIERMATIHRLTSGSREVSGPREVSALCTKQ